MQNPWQRRPKVPPWIVEFKCECIFHRPASQCRLLLCRLWWISRACSSYSSLWKSLIDLQGTTEEAAKDIAAFVAVFFEHFNKFKGRPFHFAGSSYGVSPFPFAPLHHLHHCSQGRYLPIYASFLYDQNTRLVERGMTPINLTSVMLGLYSLPALIYRRDNRILLQATEWLTRLRKYWATTTWPVPLCLRLQYSIYRASSPLFPKNILMSVLERACGWSKRLERLLESL